MGKIVIDSTNFLAGMSLSDYTSDGGFSSVYGGYNLDVFDNNQNSYRGLLCSAPPVTAIASGNTASGSFATITSGTNGVSEVHLAVDTTGKFYSMSSGGVLTLAGTDATKEYSAYKSDSVFYNGAFFVSSTTDIALVNSAITTISPTWLTATMGQPSLSNSTPTPLLVFSDYMYFANANKVFRYNGSSITTVMTMEQGYKVVAMEAHNGSIYISVERSINASGGQHSRAMKILIWDGYSPKIQNEFTMPAKTFTMKSVNGRLYLFTTNYLGYWNGIGVSPIYHYGDNNSFIYKQFITTYQDRLLFTDQWNGIISFDGSKLYRVFVPDNSTTFTETAISSIFCGYEDTLIAQGVPNNICFSLELDEYGDGGKFPTHKYQLDDLTWIRKIRVYFKDQTDTTTTTAFYYNDEKSTANSIGALSSEETYIKEFTVNKQLREFQLYVDFGTDPKPIKSIVIEYDKTR